VKFIWGMLSELNMVLLSKASFFPKLEHMLCSHQAISMKKVVFAPDPEKIVIILLIYPKIMFCMKAI